MSDLMIIYKALLKILKNFAPGVIALIIGLTYLYIDGKGLLAGTRKAK